MKNYLNFLGVEIWIPRDTRTLKLQNNESRGFETGCVTNKNNSFDKNTSTNLTKKSNKSPVHLNQLFNLYSCKNEKLQITFVISTEDNIDLVNRIASSMNTNAMAIKNIIGLENSFNYNQALSFLKGRAIEVHTDQILIGSNFAISDLDIKFYDYKVLSSSQKLKKELWSYIKSTIKII